MNITLIWLNFLSDPDCMSETCNGIFHPDFTSLLNEPNSQTLKFKRKRKITLPSQTTTTLWMANLKASGNDILCGCSKVSGLKRKLAVIRFVKQTVGRDVDNFVLGTSILWFLNCLLFWPHLISLRHNIIRCCGLRNQMENWERNGLIRSFAKKQLQWLGQWCTFAGRGVGGFETLPEL